MMTESVLFMARSVFRVQRYCNFSSKTRKKMKNAVRYDFLETLSRLIKNHNYFCNRDIQILKSRFED